jgi:hypothetical protein
MTGTLLPRRSQDFGRRCNVNSGRWAAGPPPAPGPLLHSKAARGRRCRHTHLPVPSAPTDTPPQSVGERVASRELLEGGRPGPPRARLTDCTDVHAPPGGGGGPRSPWHHVWAAVAHVGLSFVERACAWGFLQGCFFTGAFMRYVSMPVSPADRFCLHSTCGAPHSDTLSYVFLTCPLARQFEGGCTLWGSMAGRRFPMSVAVLLANNRWPWRPARDAEALWVRLRLRHAGALEGTLPLPPRRPHPFSL